MTYTTAQVNGWYQSVQFRDGPTSTVNSYVSLLNSGGLSAAQVQSAVINDTYTFANANSVIRIYQGAFNRVPDAAGQNYWTDIMGATPDAQKPAQLQTIATQFANSTEFLGVYGVNGSAPINGAVLTAFYQNILQRAPDTAGYAYWLNSGQNVATVLNAFSQSAEFVVSSQTPTTNFQQAQINGTAATSGSLWQYGGGSGTTVTYDLTTNVDTINNTKDSIIVNGTVLGEGGGNTTYTPGDSITGGQANTNVLNLSISGDRNGVDVTSASQTLKNIQTVNISNFATGGVGSLSTFDASLWSGVNAINMTASSSGGGLNGGTTISNPANLVTATMSNGKANFTLKYNDAVVEGSADKQTLTLNGQTGGKFAANGIEELNITAGKTESKDVQIDLDGNVLKTVTITGSGKLGATFDDTSITNVDASAATGALTLNIAAAVANQDITVTGGSGDDVFNIGATFTSADKIDGGAGANTIVITGGLNSTTAASGIKNFSALRVESSTAAGDAITVNMDSFNATTITTIEDSVRDTIADADTAHTLTLNNVKTDSTLVLKNTNATTTAAGGVIGLGTGSFAVVNLKNDSSNDKLNIISKGQNAAGITSASTETVTFSSVNNTDGSVTTNNLGFLKAAAASTLTVTGSAALRIGGGDAGATGITMKESTDVGSTSTYDGSAGLPPEKWSSLKYGY